MRNINSFFYRTLGLLLITYSSISAGTPSTYCIPQQYNDACVYMPIYNLSLVEDFAKNNYKPDKDTKFYNRKEWLGLNIQHDITWRSMFNEIEDFYLNYNYLKSFIQDLRNNNLFSLPHFYLENGAIALHRFNPLSPTSNIMNFLSLPFLSMNTKGLTDKNVVGRLVSRIFSSMLDAVELTAPCGITKDGSFEYFDEATKKYKKRNRDQTSFTITRNTKTIEVDGYALIQKHKEYLNRKDTKISINVDKTFKDIDIPSYLKNHSTVLVAQPDKHPTLGSWFFKCVYAPSAGESEDLSFTNQTHIIYMTGLYKLMLLVLGLDSKNNIIAENGKKTPYINDPDEIGDVMADLQKLCNSNTDNPWNSNSFKKEKFLQYQLAKILKEDKELTEKCKKVVDILFPSWQQYEDVCNGKYYNSPNKKTRLNLNKHLRYLPGPEQMLAYLVMANIKLLWYGAQDPEALRGEEIFFGPSLYVKWCFRNLKNAAYKKKIFRVTLDKKRKIARYSFMDIWKSLREKLLKKEPIQHHYINFSGHGFVASFDPKMIQLQKESNTSVHDQKLLDDLRIVITDSWQSSFFKSVFYQKKPSVPAKKK